LACGGRLCRGSRLIWWAGATKGADSIRRFYDSEHQFLEALVERNLQA